MKNRVTFLVVVEYNIDEYPEDQFTEVCQDSYISEHDGYLSSKDAAASGIASRMLGRPVVVHG